MTGIKIISTGAAAPSKVVSNDDLAQIVETSDEWIKQCTGMSFRHYVADGENHTMLAEKAAREALERSGLQPSDIGAVIVCTVSSDYFSPSTACLIQGRLGLPKDIIAFDLSAGCSGFIFGLEDRKSVV